MKSKLCLSILSLFFILGCGTAKKTVNFSKVKNGEQLDMANELTVEQFIQIWINNTYPVKIDINCHELYKDENYTYFGKNSIKFLNIEPTLFKVNTDSLNLQLGNYSKIDGEIIRQEFWEMIIPKSDKDIWKDSKCMTSTSRPTFVYELQDRKIYIELNWRIKCDGIKIHDKTYYGNYDLTKMELEKQ
jgi:hypothetical protein